MTKCAELGKQLARQQATTEKEAIVRQLAKPLAKLLLGGGAALGIANLAGGQKATENLPKPIHDTAQFSGNIFRNLGRMAYRQIPQSMRLWEQPPTVPNFKVVGTDPKTGLPIIRKYKSTGYLNPATNEIIPALSNPFVLQPNTADYEMWQNTKNYLANAKSMGLVPTTAGKPVPNYYVSPFVPKPTAQAY